MATLVQAHPDLMKPEDLISYPNPSLPSSLCPALWPSLFCRIVPGFQVSIQKPWSRNLHQELLLCNLIEGMDHWGMPEAIGPRERGERERERENALITQAWVTCLTWTGG